jgi:DMSO/TMAO reductase YedYZ molybdopterin-dependent catalytic subunit
MEMFALLHPDTLLAYEMNGAPLTKEHGAPLRLVSMSAPAIRVITGHSRLATT